MQHRVTLKGRGSASFQCRPGQSVLAAMNAGTVRVIDSGCRSGGCGVCKVQVLDGTFETGTMSRAQVSEADERKGIVLACQLYPLGDLVLQAVPRTQWAPPGPSSFTIGNADQRSSDQRI